MFGLGLGLGFGRLNIGQGGGETAPAQFGDVDWSIADLNTVDDARVTITALPATGGSPITSLQYQVDGGSWTALGGTTTGTYDIHSLTYNTVQAVAIRAVNAVGGGTASNTQNVTPTAVAEADTLAAAMSTPPTTTRMQAIHTLISSLKSGALSSSNIWAKFDLFYVTCAADSQAARLNWRNPGTFTLTEVNSPTFVADSAYDFNGTTQELTTTYVSNTGGNLFIRDACHLGVYSKEDSASSAFDWGETTATTNGVKGRGSANAAVRVNVSGSSSGATNVGAAPIHIMGIRRISTTQLQFSNGVQNSSSAGSSVATTASTWGIGRAVALYSDRKIMAAHNGGVLNDNEALDTYNALHVYMQTVAGIA